MKINLDDNFRCTSCGKVVTIILNPMQWCSQCWSSEMQRSNATNDALGRERVEIGVSEKKGKQMRKAGRP